MSKLLVIGKHAYGKCGYCGKLVRMTGWFAGWHVCLTDEEIAAKQQAKAISNQIEERRGTE